MKPLKCRLAPRESEGEPFRYFPVKTPRPIGDQARTPIFISMLAGITSLSISRFKSEYSFCVEIIDQINVTVLLFFKIYFSVVKITCLFYFKIDLFNFGSHKKIDISNCSQECTNNKKYISKLFDLTFLNN